MTDTRTQLLDVAERLTQTQGFNGFSYIDLSKEVGVKTSSIHYHFRTKADLALALVERTHEAHSLAFRNMDSTVSKPEKRLSMLVEAFESYVKEDKFCLCGMLAAELQSVSPTVRSKLKVYFDNVRAWVMKQLKEMGVKDASNRALSFVSALEGALLLARLNGDTSLIRNAMKQVK